MWLVKVVVVIVVFSVAVMFYTLQRNGANLTEEPGLSKRLAVFLKTNSAATSDDPLFEELRTPVFQLSVDDLYDRVLAAAADLRWTINSHDSDRHSVEIIVRSPVFLFEDDVYVEVREIDARRSSLFIESRSRKGDGDMAANSGHIQKLIAEVRKQVSMNPPG